MRHLRLAGALILACALLAPGVRSAGPKPEPSKHLIHAFRMFLLLEEKIEHLEWDAALGIGEVVRAECLRLAADLRGAAGDGKTDDFFFELGRLLKVTEGRDVQGSLAAYGKAEEALFDVLDTFFFRAHPVLPILDADVHEALELVREGNLRHAGEEVAEVSVYFRTAREVLDDKGVAEEDLAAFEAGIRRAAESIAGADAGGAEAALSVLVEKSQEFLSL